MQFWARKKPGVLTEQAAVARAADEEVPTLSFEIFQRDNRNNGSPDISE